MQKTEKEIVELDVKVQSLERDKEEKVSFVNWGKPNRAPHQ